MKPTEQALSIWPASASVSAGETDHLIWSFTVLTLVLVIPIFIGITFFAIRYRDGKKVNRKYREDRDRQLEIGWMLIPFVLTLIFFVWGAQMFIVHKNPPPSAMRIEAIGRQWMWKFQHPGGQAEINDLHVPTGEPILINMISQDVIHSLYIPGAAHPDGDAPGPLHPVLVQRRPTRHLPHPMQRILRHRSLRHGRHPDHHDPGRLRDMAHQGRQHD